MDRLTNRQRDGFVLLSRVLLVEHSREYFFLYLAPAGHHIVSPFLTLRGKYNLYLT